MIKPTIGRVVWFWPLGSNPASEEHQPYPALVTFVHNEYVVNLAVFDRNGDIQPRQNVQMFQAGPGEGRPQEPHCEWMPYQKGQAAKQEPDLTYHLNRISTVEAELAGMRNFIASIAKDIAEKQAAKGSGPTENRELPKNTLNVPPPPASNAATPIPPLGSSNSTNSVPQAG